MITPEEHERERYESRRKAERDLASTLLSIEQSEERGELIGRIQFCEQVLKLPVTPRARLAAMSLGVLRAIQVQLEALVFHDQDMIGRP
jgi:hypothetical protein